MFSNRLKNTIIVLHVQKIPSYQGFFTKDTKDLTFCSNIIL